MWSQPSPILSCANAGDIEVVPPTVPPGSDVWDFSDAATDDVGGAGAWVRLKKPSSHQQKW
jgi:hypothetical protein